MTFCEFVQNTNSNGQEGRSWNLLGALGRPRRPKGGDQIHSGAHHGAHGGQQGLQEVQKGFRWSQHVGRMSLQRSPMGSKSDPFWRQSYKKEPTEEPRSAHKDPKVTKFGPKASKTSPSDGKRVPRGAFLQVYIYIYIYIYINENSNDNIKNRRKTRTITTTTTTTHNNTFQKQAGEPNQERTTRNHPTKPNDHATARALRLCSGRTMCKEH